jgi:hypothetical protein
MYNSQWQQKWRAIHEWLVYIETLKGSLEIDPAAKESDHMVGGHESRR